MFPTINDRLFSVYLRTILYDEFFMAIAISDRLKRGPPKDDRSYRMKL